MAYCGPKGIPLSTFLAWSEADQDAALQWQSHESRRCTQCGAHPDVLADDPAAYVPEVQPCPACALLEQKQDETRKATTRRGLHIRLRRRR